MDRERFWADALLSEMTEDELAEYLIGKPDPTANILINCSDEFLYKAFRAIAASVQLPYIEELGEQIIDIAVSAVQSRIKFEGSDRGVVEALLNSLLFKSA